MMASSLWNRHPQLGFQYESSQFSIQSRAHSGHRNKIYCYNSNDTSNTRPERTGIQLYRDIERKFQRSPSCLNGEVKKPGQTISKGHKNYDLMLNLQLGIRLVTENVRQSQDAWGGSGDWSEVEGAWVLKPRNSKPTSVVHFVGGIFVGAAPQLTYRLFLERLSEKGILVIATPYASGFDHFFIADEVQFKFDRCLRFLQETVQDLPTFGIGHSLGSVIHLLIGSRYAVQRNGNVLMAFNNK
ncbi:unnamed protein product [Camellia sinensis]